jgi:uncharacterized protein YraI
MTRFPRLVRGLLAGLVLMVIGLAAPAAFAATAYVMRDATMRAGPGSSYPRVLVVPGGKRVSATDCMAGWCRVHVFGAPGFVRRDLLDFYGGPVYRPPGYRPPGEIIIRPPYHHRPPHWDRPPHHKPPHWDRPPHHKPPHGKPPHGKPKPHPKPKQKQHRKPLPQHRAQ